MDTKNGSTGCSRSPVLVSTAFNEMNPETFHTHVKSMYEVRTKGSKPAKPPSIAPGLAISRTKTGKVSIRYLKANRPFKYVLREEISALAREAGFTTAEVWNEFKKKGFMIEHTRLDAEKQLAYENDIPWE